MTQRLLLAACAVFLVATGLVWGLEQRTPEPVALTPALTGEVEYCLTCHAGLAECCVTAGSGWRWTLTWRTAPCAVGPTPPT
jgi:hypothetical protein